MDLEVAHEKDYWEIPDSITAQVCTVTNAEQQGTCPLDGPPDHPPLPVPRTPGGTMERRPKMEPVEEEGSSESSGDGVVTYSICPRVSNGEKPKSAANSPSKSPADDSVTYSTCPAPVSKEQKRTLPVSNGLRPDSNLELARLSFPSDDDVNLTVPMIPNPVVIVSRASTPTEENRLLGEEDLEDTPI